MESAVLPAASPTDDATPPGSGSTVTVASRPAYMMSLDHVAEWPPEQALTWTRPDLWRARRHPRRRCLARTPVLGLVKTD